MTVKTGGVSVSVYDMSGKVSGKVSLPNEIFTAKINPDLMAQAVRVYLFTQRRGMASTKTRGEVNGTTKKIYRQKGTGRARHGAAKAPIFVGGGITFGPKPHDFALTLPRKMRRAALFSALTAKLQDEKVKVVDLASATGKTKEIVATLKSLDLTNKKGVSKVMVVIDTEGRTIAQAARNIEGVVVSNAASLTTYGVMNAGTVIFAKQSLETLRKTFIESSKKQA